MCGSAYQPWPFSKGTCSVGCKAEQTAVRNAMAQAAAYDRAKADGRVAAQQSLKRARLRGVTVETVNPMLVFERDRWMCHLCGKAAPKRLRGTYDDNAPELDHIVPLAAGGEHSYRNTACAHRSCNRIKGSSPLGQTRLFG